MQPLTSVFYRAIGLGLEGMGIMGLAYYSVTSNSKTEFAVSIMLYALGKGIAMVPTDKNINALENKVRLLEDKRD